MLPLLVGIEGETLSPREREMFSRMQPAGYILFERNIADYEAARELTDELRSLTADPDAPIIAIDQEGGRVVRTRRIGVRHPSAAELAATEDSHLIIQSAGYTAQCLQTLGVNVDFAPVLDIGSGHANALPSRCWGRDSQSVTSWAGTWNRAFSRTGLLTCGKHFPGMGAAECDPHYKLPVIRGTKDDFLADAAIPFMALMPELPSLMIAHLMLPDIDKDLPSSLSPALVQGFLRQQLGYNGIIFTDDLCMGAIAAQYAPAEAAALALRAGCDLPLICHHSCEYLDSVAEAIAKLPAATREESARRISRFRLCLSSFKPKTFLGWDSYLRDLAAFNAKIPEEGEPLPSSPVQTY